MNNQNTLPVPLPYHYQRQATTTGSNQRRKNLKIESWHLSGRVREGWSESLFKGMNTTKNLNLDNKGWLTIPQVCVRLSISYDTWAKWRQRQVAPKAIRLPNGQLRTREDWLQAFMDDLAVVVSVVEWNFCSYS